MERASRLIRKLSLPAASITNEELALAAWPDAVGKTIAAHTRAAKMVRSRLVVEVEDVTWQRQLFALTPHILKNLEKALGPGVAEEVEFRVLPRRREPQQATRSVPSAPLDESDSISDPVLRRIYRASRKRAQA
jgi:predicted nucleic acid-binding Zn ribbon protein